MRSGLTNAARLPFLISKGSEIVLKVVGKFILLTTLVALAGSFLAAQGNDQEGGESSVLGVWEF